MGNFLKSELFVQPDTGILVRRDIRENGMKALPTGGVNQFLEKPAPNPLTVKIMMYIDGVFQGAGDGISGPE
jgi:hypothetical protein